MSIILHVVIDTCWVSRNIIVDWCYQRMENYNYVIGMLCKESHISNLDMEFDQKYMLDT